MSPRLRVNPITCEVHGLCAGLLPELIRLDDWGFPVIRREAIPPDLMTRARWAVANCPALALKLRKQKA